MALGDGCACARIVILLTIYGSLQCVNAASDLYAVSPTHLKHIDAHEPVRLTDTGDERLHRERRSAINPFLVPAAVGAGAPQTQPAPAPTDIKNQYQSVSANAGANASATSADTTVTTVDSNAAAAAAANSISYNVHNVGVNGTGQRRDYSVQTNDGTATAAGAAATTINVTAGSGAPVNVESKKAGLMAAQSQYPKKTAATQQTATTSEKPLIDDVDVSEDVMEKETSNHNLTIQEDHHDYYNSSLYVSKDEVQAIWAQVSNITSNTMLSSSHRRAMTVELSFDFPFYGHYLRNITVATGGFLYTGEYVHSWLAATQYIAPLMANFDTSISKDSFVRHQDNGTALTVVWENVALQDKTEYGNFTFSVTLHQNGNIVFAYYQVPTLINNIQDVQHPVKVGLSDAYIIDKFLYFARRKTIYEYHRVSFTQQKITNNTIIHLTALPTCLGYNDCQSCINHKTTFECGWCSSMNRCSTGTDRKKQEWQQRGCDRSTIDKAELCPSLGQKGNNAAGPDSGSNSSNNSGPAKGGSNGANNAAPGAGTGSTPAHEVIINSTHAPPSEADSSSGHMGSRPQNRGDANVSLAATSESDPKNVGVAFGFIVPICFVFVAMLWLFYAYRNPHTKSGQLLIQYRPTQWSWRRGEARYTAATIHM